MKNAQSTGEREVLEFDFGVRVYPPARPDSYWRIRWEERHKAKDTTAKTRSLAIGKASEIVERLGRSAPICLGRATGADLVGHYLSPARRPPRTKQWSVGIATSRPAIATCTCCRRSVRCRAGS